VRLVQRELLVLDLMNLLRLVLMGLCPQVVGLSNAYLALLVSLVAQLKGLVRLLHVAQVNTQCSVALHVHRLVLGTFPSNQIWQQ
jgi:hypothetical protein